MALAGDTDAPPTRRIEAASATCINGPPSIRAPTRTAFLPIPSEKVPPAPSGSARKKGTGGEGASGNLGMLRARPHVTRIMREKTPFEHFRSGARRDKGWHATRACFFTPKTC